MKTFRESRRDVKCCIAGCQIPPEEAKWALRPDSLGSLSERAGGAHIYICHVHAEDAASQSPPAVVEVSDDSDGDADIPGIGGGDGDGGHSSSSTGSDSEDSSSSSDNDTGTGIDDTAGTDCVVPVQMLLKLLERGTICEVCGKQGVTVKGHTLVGHALRARYQCKVGHEGVYNTSETCEDTRVLTTNFRHVASAFTGIQ